MFGVCDSVCEHSKIWFMCAEVLSLVMELRRLIGKEQQLQAGSAVTHKDTHTHTHNTYMQHEFCHSPCVSRSSVLIVTV